jgi:phospholipid/cholesterol/gamma-HCH transport system substrate-binding protein
VRRLVKRTSLRGSCRVPWRSLPRSSWRGRLLRLLVVAGGVSLSASLLTSCGSGAPPYTIKAVFQSAEGLFAGNSVEVLGVAKGTVTKVQPEADQVLVTMSIDGDQPLPASVHAALTTPQILGEPSIEMTPGYAGGPKLPEDAVIPESDTSVPISIDQLLRDLQQFFTQVNSHAVSGVINNLAQDLQGQSQGLNQLISQGASTLNLLAQKGTELGQLNGSLAEITGTLRQRTSTISQLIQAYDTVGNVINQDSGPLGNAISQLADVSQQLAGLLDPNLQPLQSDISTITQVGRTLDRNLGSLDQGLSSTVSLFAGAGRAYDTVNNWLNINVPIAEGLTGDTVAGLVRDRLAGICRRVLAHHSSGLSSSQISTLQSCGNPDSGYFDSLLAVLPNALSGAGASTGSGSQGTSAQNMIAQGTSEIPGLTPSQQQQVSQVPASSLSGNAPTHGSGLGGSSSLNPPAPKPVNSSGGSGLVGSLLHGLSGVVHFFGSLV